MAKVTDRKYRELREIVDESLAPRGFKTWSLGFFRVDGDRVETIHLNHHTCWGEDRAELDIVVGVGFKSFSRRMKKCPPSGHGDFTSPKSALVSRRMEQDWQLLPKTYLEGLGDQVLGVINRQALPFLAGLPTLESVLEEWKGARHAGDLRVLMLTPAVLWHLGRRAEADTFIAGQVSKDLKQSFFWNQFREYLLGSD